MSKDNARTISHWLILCLAGFSLGTILGGVAQRNVLKALTTGAVGAPIMCVSGLLITSGQQTSQKKSSQTSPRRISAQTLQKQALQPTSPSAPTPAIPGHRNVADRVAIFWDYENVHRSAPAQITQLAHAIDDLAQSKGHCAKKFVYSNWRQESQKAAPTLTSHGFDAIHVEMGKPNSVDVKLAVECISTAYEHPEIRHFVLVTSDKDYISLVNKLQELQREVILVGSDRTSSVMRQSAAQFIPLSDVLSADPRVHNATSTDPKSDHARLSFEDGIECLLSVLSRFSQRLATQEPSVAQSSSKHDAHLVSLPKIDKAMRKESSVDYQGCGSICQPRSTRSFKKFSHFIQAVEVKGLIKTQQHNSRTYVSLTPLLTFQEAMECVVYGLWMEYQSTQSDAYQEVNIASLHKLIHQHLGLEHFTPTKIPILRQSGRGHYATLSKFLKDVAETDAIALRRESNFVYVKLSTAPSKPKPPATLLTHLAEIQTCGIFQPLSSTELADSISQDHIMESSAAPDIGQTHSVTTVSAYASERADDSAEVSLDPQTTSDDMAEQSSDIGMRSPEGSPSDRSDNQEPPLMVA